ncbi:hypothetical protein D030_3765A, partial [Vibrio parahaemolyticus AQ3810]
MKQLAFEAHALRSVRPAYGYEVLHAYCSN